MEHRMLGLMAQKVMAAALLYGDNASSAMSAETDEEDLLAALAKAALNKLPIASGIEAVLAPTMQQDESIEMVDDVDTADLAAMFDAEEREDEQAAFDGSTSSPTGSAPEHAEGEPAEALSTTTTGARRNGGPGRIWPNSPAPKRRRSQPPPTCQTNSWTSSCWPPWLPPVQPPKPKSQPSVVVAASARSGSAAAHQAMLF
jgi:hypothetical protein